MHATDHVAIGEFTVELDVLARTGRDLQRPESVLAETDSSLWVSDARGGCTRIAGDGTQQFFGGWGGSPNGLAIDRDGSMLGANIDLHRVQRLHRDGRTETVLAEVDGQLLSCANFVFVDRRGRLWISCSTREQHWWPAVNWPRPDGFVVLVDERGPRIVADGITFTNEARLDADEAFLYVAETMRCRMLRFPVHTDGSLGEREVFGPDSLGEGAFVDGFALDVAGNVWLTTVVRNGVGIITSAGDYHVVFEDPREELLRDFTQRLVAGGEIRPEDLGALAGPRVQLPTSVAFAGPDLRTVYIGSLAMPHLVTFHSPVSGLPMSHWR